MQNTIFVENFMTSVERIVEYGSLKSEANIDNAHGQAAVNLSYDLSGPLQFDRVWLKYADDEKYVLKNISFTVKENEKVTVVVKLYSYLTLYHYHFKTDRCGWANWCRKVLTHHCPLSFGTA